ncbi:MAG: hypothetical protein WAQ27_02520 [Candidatus Microsaccharimonas sp.]
MDKTLFYTKSARITTVIIAAVLLFLVVMAIAFTDNTYAIFNYTADLDHLRPWWVVTAQLLVSLVFWVFAVVLGIALIILLVFAALNVIVFPLVFLFGKPIGYRFPLRTRYPKYNSFIQTFAERYLVVLVGWLIWPWRQVAKWINDGAN